MGVMNKMRENTAIVLYVLVFSFGGLWMLQDSGVFEAMGLQTTRDIAVVDGQPVSYLAWQNAVEQQVQSYQQQSGGQPLPPQLRTQIENSIYDALVMEVLIDREMERMGLTISDREVRNMLVGPNPHQVVRQNFPDGEGGVDRAQLNQFVELARDDREIRERLIALEDYLRNERRQEKLQALISSTVRVSNAEVTAELLNRNTSASTQFVALRYADVPDDQVQVTDRDLRRYYDDNRETYRRERSVTVQYVEFPRVATEEDSLLARRDLERLRSGFAQADDPAQFAQREGSDMPARVEPLPPNELPAAVATAIYSNPEPGRVTEVAFGDTEAEIVRITSVEPSDETFVRARHILVRERAEADQVLARLAAGESFQELARTLSQDPGSGMRGGDLGFFGRGAMVAPFEEAAFGAPVGQTVGPVESDFGFHIIRVESRTNQIVEGVRIVRFVEGSAEVARERAEDLRFYVEEGDATFESEAQRLGVEIETVEVVGEPEGVIPGLPPVGRQGIRFLNRGRAGAISESIDAEESYVVMRIVEVRPEGIRPFDEVRQEIEPRVLLQKKREHQAARMREALQQAGGDLNRLAATLGVNVQSAEDVRFTSPVVSGIGREPRFTGTALGLPANRTSGVVEGDNLAFVIRVTTASRPDPASFTQEQRDAVREQIINRRRQAAIESWIERLRENATITDNRAVLLGT
ncbi:peptidyl-prolyl cis-trans isomerase [soil metagenome]